MPHLSLTNWLTGWPLATAESFTCSVSRTVGRPVGWNLTEQPTGKVFAAAAVAAAADNELIYPHGRTNHSRRESLSSCVIRDSTHSTPDLRLLVFSFSFPL